jgi:hypothetical protein
MRKLAVVVCFCGALVIACGSPMAPSSALQVLAVTPNQGTTFGGTPITIVGSHFSETATVTIGGDLAKNVVVHDSTSISAVTPTHGAGSADIVISGRGTIAALRNGFTFVRPE